MADPFALFDGVEDEIPISEAPAISTAPADSGNGKNPPHVADIPPPGAAAPPSLASLDLQLTLPLLLSFAEEHMGTIQEDLRSIAQSTGKRDLSRDLAQQSSLDCDHLFAALRQLNPARTNRPLAPAADGAALTAEDALVALAVASANLVKLTWAWMKSHGSWPHVVFRELYCLAQLSSAVARGAAADTRGAMEALDMALIMGIPGREVSRLIDVFDAACQNAANVADAAPTHIPRVLGPDARVELFDLPRLPGLPRGTTDAAAAAAHLQPTETPINAPPAGVCAPRSAIRVLRVAGLPTPGLSMARSEKASSPSSASASIEHPALAAWRAVDEPKPLPRPAFFTRFVEPSPSLLLSGGIVAHDSSPSSPSSRCVPVVISGAIRNWPALDAWRNLAALHARHGHRTVPIEIGQHLSGGTGAAAAAGGASATDSKAAAVVADAADAWREEPMLLSRFIDEYLGPSASAWGCPPPSAPLSAPSTAPPSTPPAVGYLAQHGLFDQIPALVAEGGFGVPLYVGDDVGAVNVWIGTAGTKTRLHYDAYNNLLCQVAGYKFVRLFSPSQSGLLYTIAGGASGGVGPDAQGNISAVDVEHPDGTAHPRFGDAQPFDCVLGPGDALFIPKGWWHYVRSLSVSVSVNFWW